MIDATSQRNDTRSVNLVICGRDDLATIVGDFTHVISIWDAAHGRTGFDALEAHFPRSKRLFLSFDDITQSYNGVLPTVENVKEAIEFAEDAESLLVHCKAGISRSTAIAYAILCAKSGAGTEKECLEELVRIRSVAIPNKLMVSLADTLLERNGAMILENEKRHDSMYMFGASDDEL
jgi:predicted protein tyrosine phosphatase